jgi:hypothetical protein
MDTSGDQPGHTSAAATPPTPEFLSPGGKSRYGRTRRPKISRDFYNIDDVIIDDNPPRRQSPLKSPKLKPPPKAPILPRELVFEIKDEFTKLDDLGMKVANNFKTNLQRGLDDTIKERKFFKSLPENKLEVPNVVDVTKVFKLISKPPILEVCETRTPAKTALKTYSNKRKHTTHDSDCFIVESFGLPDEPIIPVKSPVALVRDTKIDVETGCDVDVNLANPWAFDNAQTVPVCGGDPIEAMEEISLNRRGLLDLYPYNSLLSKNMEVDNVFDLTSNCQSNKTWNPTSLSVKNVKTVQCDIKQEVKSYKSENLEVVSNRKAVLTSKTKRLVKNEHPSAKYVEKQIETSVNDSLKGGEFINESFNNGRVLGKNEIKCSVNNGRESLGVGVVKKMGEGVIKNVPLKKKAKIKVQATRRILRSNVDNNNVEIKSEYPLISVEDSPPNISQKSLRSSAINKVRDSTPPKLTPYDADVSPEMECKYSEKIANYNCKQHVRVILNPLAHVNRGPDKNLVLNPFRIKSENPKAPLLPQINMRSPENNLSGITKVIIGNNRNALKKTEIKRLSKPPDLDLEIGAQDFDIKPIKAGNLHVRVGSTIVNCFVVEMIEFEAGDLTWAKIGTHPYWPCMVTEEPSSGQHRKIGKCKV